MTILTKTQNGIEVPLSAEEIEVFNTLKADHEAEQEELKKTEYQRQRKAEYYRKNITPENMIIALWERVVENRPESANALQLVRDQVKQEFPKPS